MKRIKEKILEYNNIKLDFEKTLNEKETELKEIKLKEIKLKEIKLKEIKLKEIKLKEIKLKEIKLKEIKLKEIKLKEIKLKEIKLKEIKLKEIKLKEIKLKEIKLKEIKLKEIKLKEIKLKEIKQELVDIKIPVDEFNKNLKNFIGRDNIKLEYDDEKQSYKLKRDNEDTEKSLSEGEKTIISLVHFIMTLSYKMIKNKNLSVGLEELEEVDNEENNLSDCIVVIDDPISSLDSNFVYNVYAYLQTKLSGCKQIFILTHHFYFFKRVQKWFEHEGNKDNYKIKEIMRNNNISTIEDVNQFLNLYETKYQYIYDKVLRLKKKCDEKKILTYDEKISLPNECRKIFESAASFLYPFGNKGRGSMSEKRTKYIINNITNNLDDKYKEWLYYIYRYSNIESHLQNFDYINLHLKNDEESYNLIKYTIMFIEDYITNHLSNYNEKILNNDNEKNK